MKYYTGVGSRKTPEDILKLIWQISRKYALSGWVVRSGGADGADKAFAKGSFSGQKEIYLPWENFNELRRGVKDNGVQVVSDPLSLQRATELVSKIHPAWERCSDAVKKLHIRNAFQVLGGNLEVPSSVLICWAPIQGDSIKGGTRTAWEIAKLYDIPRFNLADPSTEQKFRKFVARSRSLRER